MRVSVPPNLKSLEALGLWHETTLLLLNASSLDNVSLELACLGRRSRYVDVDCHEDYVDMFRKLIQQTDDAEEVTLGSFGAQVSSFCFVFRVGFFIEYNLGITS